MYVCTFSHTFYCCHKPLPLCWAFSVLWNFPFFFLLPFFPPFYNFNFLKTPIFFLHLFLCLPFLLFFPPLMHINLLHIPLFNFAYLFFLSFPLNMFVGFVFIALFPTWHLALVLFSSLCFSEFCC